VPTGFHVPAPGEPFPEETPAAATKPAGARAWGRSHLKVRGCPPDVPGVAWF